MRMRVPAWMLDFLEPAAFKCAYGGRSAGKTTAFARYFAAKAVRVHTNLKCIRQFQNSIDVSVKPAIQDAICDLGLRPYFRFTDQRILCPRTGSVMSFHGLERNPESVRGWHEVTDVWCDEAHMLGQRAAETMIHTVRRGELATELWFSFNPMMRTDWVWKRFVERPRRGDIVAKVNWSDNPWHGEQAEDERANYEAENPHLYAHVWEGEPDDGDASERILPYSYLLECVKAYEEGLHQQAIMSRIVVGLDIADGGKDRNCIVLRRGPVIEAVELWPSTTPGDLRPTALRADTMAREANAQVLAYDAGGVGAGIRGTFLQIFHERGLQYKLTPVLFGAAVAGPEARWEPKIKNVDRFARRNAQLAWAPRMRAQNTIRLRRGENVDPTACLFISTSIPRREEFMAALSHPLWREAPLTGRIEIDKRGGDENAKSPDPFDALCLAYSTDSERGLRRGRISA